MNELKSEDLSSETRERVFFIARQINENVNIDETRAVEVDPNLNDKKTVLFSKTKFIAKKERENMFFFLFLLCS